MTQKHILRTNRIARIGYEGTFGTTSSHMLRMAVMMNDDGNDKPKTTMLPSNDATAYQHDGRAPTRGLKRGSPVKFSVYLRRIATRLTSAASAPAAVGDSAPLSHQVLFDHWFGGSHADRGSTVASAADASTVTVASGHGSRFVAGQVALVGVSGVIYPRLVSGVSTDTLSLFPALPGTPSTGDLVINTFTYYRAESHEQTFTFESAYAESGTPETQKRDRGVHGQCTWTGAIGQKPVIAFEGVSAEHDGPGDLSLSVVDALDDMGAELVWLPKVHLFSGSSSPSIFVADEFKPAVPNAWHEVQRGDGPGALNGVVQYGGRAGPATVELTFRHNSADEVTSFTTDAERTLFCYTQQGSGSSERFAGWVVPRLRITEEPVSVEKNGLLYTTIKGMALANLTVAGTAGALPLASSSTSLMRSPILFFEG